MDLQEKKVDKWSQKVDVKHGVFPKDFFANKKSAEGYANGLLKYSDGNVGKAIKRVTFYLNRGGDVSNKGALKSALKILEKRLEKQKTKKEGVTYMNADKYLTEKFENLGVVKEEKIVNINDKWGDPVEFDSVQEMKDAIRKSGYDIPEEGLKQGIDYEVVEESSLKTKYTVRCEDDTVGVVSFAYPEEVEIGREYIVKLNDENGNPITKKCKVVEILEDLEEKKLSPAEVEALKDSDEDDEPEVKKIERPQGTLRKGEVHDESIQYNERFLKNAERWMDRGILGENNQSDEIVNQLDIKISNAMNKLKKSPMRENFGQIEIRDIEDFAMKYIHDYDYASIARKLGNMVEVFRDWCNNYEPQRNR